MNKIKSINTKRCPQSFTPVVYFSRRNFDLDFDKFVKFIESQPDPKVAVLQHAAYLKDKRLLAMPGMNTFTDCFTDKYGSPDMLDMSPPLPADHRFFFPTELIKVRVLFRYVHKMIREGVFDNVNLKELAKALATVFDTGLTFASFYQTFSDVGKDYEEDLAHEAAEKEAKSRGISVSEVKVPVIPEYKYARKPRSAKKYTILPVWLKIIIKK